MSTLTLKILDLLKTEFTETQARAIAEVIDKNIEEAQKENAAIVATKAELNGVEKSITSELSSIKQDIAVIKSTMATKDEMNKLIGDLRTEMQNTRYDTIKWIVIVFSLNIITIISAILAIVKFVAK